MTLDDAVAFYSSGDNPEDTIWCIPLSKGLVTFIDIGDRHLVAGRSWYALWNGRSYYAATAIRTADGREGHLQMQNLLLPPPADMCVDHVSRWSLDNRKVNLRFATRSQNGANRSASPNARHPYRGITRSRNRWFAQCRSEGTNHCGPSRLTPEEAARDYDSMAREHHSPFAHLNFPNEI